MKMDFSDLTGNIGKDMELTEQEVVDLTAKITLDVHADVVLATPVDTNVARSGEPRRVCRRLFGISYAAMGTSSSMA